MIIGIAEDGPVKPAVYILLGKVCNPDQFLGLRRIEHPPAAVQILMLRDLNRLLLQMKAQILRRSDQIAVTALVTSLLLVTTCPSG